MALMDSWKAFICLLITANNFNSLTGEELLRRKDNKDFSDPAAYFNDKFRAVPASSFFDDDNFLGMTVPELISDGLSADHPPPQDYVDQGLYYPSDDLDYSYFEDKYRQKSFLDKLRRPFQQLFGKKR